MARKKILLVDDVELFLVLEKSFFRRDEYDVLMARNGAEALAMTREQMPDLVLMDLHMPEMSGDECCRRIKSDPHLSAIPVIMVTQGGREEDLETCHRAGCDAILLKPVNRRDFITTTKRFLELEARAAPRLSVRLRVHYGIGNQVLLQNYSVNLSIGGMFLETDVILPVDTPCTLEFFLGPQEECITCQARVAWANAPEDLKKPELPVGMGLQFHNVSLDQFHTLRKFIEEQGISADW